ncbi:FKBP-type peptidyl-prolyl cis-trans isomerase [Flavilitoribacter nigricans]|uniref:Peptidyl-prolyl cis-trans isomerase n=1 Tax=Flavilitoribacter nigricans (strain ATCC 23147 / DSM 23189 / NBRC 102662 / NCIMB 1420 / SS-2) TaxID=1122177 RepID=A0A2D0NA89_FLAN2|nr:FKBP-type peptidyl-prolyl cis-trans isomerase [Flavilitoribacter nigricans]PHN05298.1 hypothetical protein CRP01_17430 [Flavilitoribacter nigricans DSM 23189 = NBRC 102662]
MNTSNRFKTFFQGGFIALFLVAGLFSGCQKEELPPSAQENLERVLSNVDPVQLNSDIAVIDDSLDMWGLADMVLKEPNGVRYLIDSTGSGNRPVLENIVEINYSGRLMSTGEEFDSGENVSFILANLIAGFQTTLPLVPTGSRVTLFIPSGLGYGPNDVPDAAGNIVVPANSNLIFEVDLLDIF